MARTGGAPFDLVGSDSEFCAIDRAAALGDSARICRAPEGVQGKSRHMMPIRRVRRGGSQSWASATQSAQANGYRGARHHRKNGSTNDDTDLLGIAIGAEGMPAIGSGVALHHEHQVVLIPPNVTRLWHRVAAHPLIPIDNELELVSTHLRHSESARSLKGLPVLPRTLRRLIPHKIRFHVSCTTFDQAWDPSVIRAPSDM